MKQDFIDYIQETFKFSKKEMWDFESALSKPLWKSIRINTNKISVEDFLTLAKQNNWSLTPSWLGENMFYIDREDTSVALWNSLEHINGYFYIQEVAASSSPYYMSGDIVDTDPYLILDMSASPGWKTTELAEYYPNSLIIANEIDKARLKGLFINLDRMWTENVVCTNYDGRFFKQTWEIFDKVLLDAPCSGEWTSFKTDDALKYWNLKNIKRIAKLQFGLLEAAVKSTKVWGEIIYSTCTLNTLENEQIVEKILKKYNGIVEIENLNPEASLWQKIKKSLSWQDKTGKEFIRAWPHKNNTGWFFVAKLIKTVSLEEDLKKIEKVQQGFEKIASKDVKNIKSYLRDRFDFNLSWYSFYMYRDEVYITAKSLDSLWERLFFKKIWVKIGFLKSSEFTPNFYLGTLSPFSKWTLSISDSELDGLFKWKSLNSELSDGYYQAVYKKHPAGMCKVKNGKLESLIESTFVRG